MSSTADRPHSTTPVLLRRDGVALLIDPQPHGLPAVLHWGADPGEMRDTDLLAWRDAVGRQSAPGTLDAAWQLNLLPQELDGWAGRPGAQLVLDGLPLSPRWTDVRIESDGPRAVVYAVAGDLRLTIECGIRPGGLLTLRHRIALTPDAGSPV